jgi:hypothetical protein
LYDPAPFLHHGISVENLVAVIPTAVAGDNSGSGGGGVGGGGEVGITLQALDRFLALLNAAAGRPIAIHCAGRLGYALGLVAAHLVRSRLFPSAIDAVSWLQIVRPGRPNPAADARAMGWAAAAALLDRARPSPHRRASFSEEFALAAAVPSDISGTALEWTYGGEMIRPPSEGAAAGGAGGRRRSAGGDVGRRVVKGRKD